MSGEQQQNATGALCLVAAAESPQFTGMGWQAFVVLGILLLMFVVLFMEKGAPDQVLLAALVVLWNLGIIDTVESLSGFGNAGLITIGALFIVVQAVDRSGVVDRVARRILGRNSSESIARLRLCLVGFSLSGFLNNTPLVALLLPIVRDWARARGFAASKFLLPLSYSTIMGGLITVIGTSTNLLVSGLMEQEGLEPFGFFDPAFVSLPVGLVGLLYLLGLGHRCLPENKGGLFRAFREQCEEMITALELTPHYPMIGRGVYEALDKLGVPHQSLLKIIRQMPPPVRPRHRSQAEIQSNCSGERPSRRNVGVARENGGVNEDQENREIEDTIDVSDAGHIFWDKELVTGEVDGRGSHNVSATVSPVKLGRALMEDGSPANVEKIIRCSSTPAIQHEDLQLNVDTNDGGFPRAVSDNDIVLQRRKHGLNISDADKQLSSRSFRLNMERNYTDPNVTVIFPVPDHEITKPGDVLLISVGQEALVDILSKHSKGHRQFKGIRLKDTIVDVVDPNSEFVELVLAITSPVVGTKLALGAQTFEQKYKVAFVAVRRRAVEAVDGQPGGQFAAGDIVLVLAATDTVFSKRDFLLVTKIADLPKPVKLYDYLPLPLFFAGLLLAAFSVMPMVKVAVTLAVLFVLGGWVQAWEIEKVVDWHLLILIGSALGISRAVQRSGLSMAMAAAVKAAGLPPQGALALLFFITMVTTELITNNAAAALGLPLAIDLAAELGMSSPRPFAMGVMLAASTSYASPIGYATNLMVLGPGGYMFADFARIGIVMDLIYLIGCTLIVPIVWPLV